MADKFSVISRGVPNLGMKRQVLDIHFAGGFNTGQFIYFGTNVSAPTANTAAEGGTLALATTTSSADGCFARSAAFVNFNHANELWEFSVKAKFDDATNSHCYFVVADVPASNSALVSSGLVDGVGYVKAGGATTIALQDLINSVDQGGNTNVGTQDTNAHWLKLRVQTGATAGVGTVELSRDGNVLATLTGVTLPTSTNLAIIVGNQANTGAARTCTVYRMFANVPDINVN